MSSKLQLDGRYYNSVVAPSGERLRGTEVEAGMVLFAGKTVVIHAWAPWSFHD